MESKFSVESETKTLEIESFLANNAYLSGGPLPNAQDSEVYFSLKGAPDQSKYPNFYYWFSCLCIFNPAVIKSWAAKKEQPQQQKQAKKEETPKVVEEAKPKVEEKPKAEEKPAAADDDVDLFGDDDDEAEKEILAKKKAEEEAKKAAKKKAAPVAKSIIIFDVKIIDEEQDLDALAKKVLTIEMDGLQWKTEYKKVPVAYGVQKLQMGCTVEDEKVSTDDLFDKILAWEDEVQSVDVVQFQKV